MTLIPLLGKPSKKKFFLESVGFEGKVVEVERKMIRRVAEIKGVDISSLWTGTDRCKHLGF